MARFVVLTFTFVTWVVFLMTTFAQEAPAVTKDNVLICLHDESLERTTNIEDVFPDRATVNAATGRPTWLAADFTLAEVKRLDAGSWFDPKFSAERILTFDEAVALVGTRAGLYPELKTPALYRARGVDQTALFVAAVTRLGLHTRPRGALIVQSFDPQPLRDLTIAEMRYYLFELGVDAVFTDNPDRFPRRN